LKYVHYIIWDYMCKYCIYYKIEYVLEKNSTCAIIRLNVNYFSNTFELVANIEKIKANVCI